MRSITITSDEAIFPQVLALISGKDATPQGAKAAPAGNVTFDGYDAMDREQLKNLVRENGILKQVRNAVSDDKLRELLTAYDEAQNGTSGDEEEEEDEEELDEEEVEEVEEEEGDIEVGMKVRASIRGKAQVCTVVSIDYDNNKVVILTKDKKKIKISPEALTPV